MTTKAKIAERWTLCDQQLKANTMNLIQVNIMWSTDRVTKSETLYTRNSTLARNVMLTMPHNPEVARIDIVSPMGQIIEEWSR